MAKTENKAKDHLRADVISSTKNLVLGTVIIALLIGIVFLAYKARLATRPPEYEGRIMDKWAGYTHSDLGSRPYFHLLLETRSGQRLTVSVDQDLYNRAKPGTWIKKTQTGVELGQTENGRAQAKEAIH